jgi:cyanophycinase
MLQTVWRWLVVALLLAWAAIEAFAQDNILGLPKPRDARFPGAVVLHGGGRITEDVFDRFVELAGDERARVVLVPSAGYRPSDYESEAEFVVDMRRRFGSWVDLQDSGEITSFEFLFTDDPRDADSAAFLKPLVKASGVWFCGGAQSRLNYRFVGEFPKQTRFQAELRGVLARGGVVGGTSAGMAAMPEIMTMWQHYEDDERPLSAVTAHGLGLFNGAIVEQHFDTRRGRLERFTGLLRKSNELDALAGRPGAGSRMLGLAIEEGTALVLRGDTIATLGGGSAHVFLKSDDDRQITWHRLAAGESAQLNRDSAGRPAMLRDGLLTAK